MQVKQFNNIAECIAFQEREAKKDFEKKYKHIGYFEKCNIHDCIKKAEYIWKPSFLIRVKSFFAMKSPAPFIPQYCRKCFLSQTRRNKTYFREGFKLIAKSKTQGATPSFNKDLTENSEEFPKILPLAELR